MSANGTGHLSWPDDPIERIEAKLDKYHDRCVTDFHSIDKRVASNEKDIATFKAASVIVGTGVFAAVFDTLKRKFGIGQ